MAFCRSGEKRDHFEGAIPRFKRDKAMPSKGSIFRCFYERDRGTVDVNDFWAVFSSPAK